METKDIVTFAIAGYAAVVSTVVAIHAIIKGRRDRGELRITAEIIMRMQSSAIIESAFIVATITNTGKRPIGVAHWCICRGGNDKREHTEHINPPERLEPSDSYVSYDHIGGNVAKGVTIAAEAYDYRSSDGV